MNPLESFGEFSSKLTTTDLMLYAGVAVVLWVLFKDKLGGLTDSIGSLLKSKMPNGVPSVVNVSPEKNVDQDVFFELVASWKRTRDLAEKAKCSKAVAAADQMFPHLSPVTCKEKTDDPATLGK